MERGYAEKSALALVGNRHRLNARQQKAVLNMSAAFTKAEARKKRSLQITELRNETLVLDGFNVLILLESLLSGAYIFRGRDGFYRDLSSVHGTYKKVQQTAGALDIVAELHKNAGPAKLCWLFDKPVSNSGRLKKMTEDLAEAHGLNWEAELVYNVDRELINRNLITISSDAWVLDHVDRNFNLIGYVIEKEEGMRDSVFDVNP